MLLTAGLALLALWVVAFVVMRKVVGCLVHLLLLVALAAIVWHFVGPRLR